MPSPPSKDVFDDSKLPMLMLARLRLIGSVKLESDRIGAAIREITEMGSSNALQLKFVRFTHTLESAKVIGRLMLDDRGVVGVGILLVNGPDRFQSRK